MPSIIRTFVAATQDLSTEALPPGDVLVSGLALAFAAGWAFLLGFLVAFSGPAVEGVDPGLVATVGYWAFGSLLSALSLGVFRQHRFGWYGTVAVVGAGAVQSGRALASTEATPSTVVVVAVFGMLLVQLVVRREAYLGRT